MDEEYRLNLNLAERIALGWATGIGKHVDKSGFARSFSNLLRHLFVFVEKRY